MRKRMSIYIVHSTTGWFLLFRNRHNADSKLRELQSIAEHSDSYHITHHKTED